MKNSARSLTIGIGILAALAVLGVLGIIGWNNHTQHSPNSQAEAKLQLGRHLGPYFISAQHQYVESGTLPLPSAEKIAQATPALSYLTKNPQLIEAVHQFLAYSQRQASHTVLVLFQNSDELRGTGGFLGSFALLEFDDHHLTSYQVFDIYDAQGQQVELQPAPPGVDEYLSGGEGLKLSNANWEPDFSYNAQTIVSMLQQIGYLDSQAVVTVGVTDRVLEAVLSLTGPIELPDYQDQVLTADNATELLRSARGDFFPGSKQKKHVLQHATSQILAAITDIIVAQPDTLFELISQLLEQKEIQAHSDQVMLLPDHPLSIPERTAPLILVENNVGINKANKRISRSLEISQVDQQLIITTQIYNNNLPSSPTTLGQLTERQFAGAGASDAAYVVYYRYLTDPNLQPVTIRQNDKEMEWHQREVRQFNRTLLETGVLVHVAEQDDATLQATFEWKSDPTDEYWLWKQPGTEPISLTVGGILQPPFEKDQLITVAD